MTSTATPKHRRIDQNPGRFPGRIPWLQIGAALVIIVGMAIFLYPQTASWFSHREQARVTGMAVDQLDSPPMNADSYRQEEIARAGEYNKALASGAILEAGANIAVGEGKTDDNSFNYNELLKVNDDGFMGRLRYGNLDIDLPIYHGTDEETLLHGVGHLEGTSLPVGGVGSRSVLTAHRGLPTATLFNDLNKAEIDDLITVSVMGEVLSYQVTEMTVVAPDDTQSILAEEGRDLLTLITCTPLGINSHRILVTAERVYPTPPEEEASMKTPPKMPGFPWWALTFSVTVILMAVYLWRAFLSQSRERAKYHDTLDEA